jgi:hypothetical protein
MRIRSLLTAGLLAAVAVVAFAPGALAQEEGEGGDATEFTEEQIEEITHEAELIGEENGGTTEDGHCIEELINGGSVDDCQEAPSPILPPANELIWGSISLTKSKQKKKIGGRQH